MPRVGRISLVDGPGVAYMVDSLKENSDNAGSCIPPGIARRPRHRLDVLGEAGGPHGLEGFLHGQRGRVGDVIEWAGGGELTGLRYFHQSGNERC